MIRRCLLRYQIEKEISQMLEDIFFISKKLDIHYVIGRLNGIGYTSVI